MNDALQIFSMFGGIAIVIWASARAKLEHKKIDMLQGKHINETSSQAPAQNPAFRFPAGNAQDNAVLTELKALKQQIGEMQNTSHQFDIAFDAALERMEQRVGRLETKAAAPSVVMTDDPTILQNGHH